MSRMFIDLDREIYRPGEIVSGKAIITLDKPLTVREVNISFTGEAHVYWTGTYNNDKSMYEKFCTDDELIFINTTTVWPRDDGPIRNSLTMPAGKYEFSVSFPIPEKTPTGLPLPDNFDINDVACSAETGYIRYLLEIRMVRPTFHFDQTLQQYVSIRGMYDLNTNPWAFFPAVDTGEMTISSWCCVSGQIEVSIKLPKTGYAIGEFLAVWAEIANRSQRTIKQVRLELIQICKFRTRTGHSKDVDTSVIAAAAKHEPVLPCRTQRWENEGFQIPLFARTSTEASRLIEFRHRLQLEVIPKGCCSENLKVWIPVIIGSVPLKAPGPSARSSGKFQRKSVK